MLVVSPLISSVPCCQLIVVSRACSGKSAARASSADCQSRVNCRWRCRCKRCSRNCCCSSKRGFVICKLWASCCSPEAKRRLCALRRCLSDAVLALSRRPAAEAQRTSATRNAEKRSGVAVAVAKINWRVHQYAFPSASPSAMAKSPPGGGSGG